MNRRWRVRRVIFEHVTFAVAVMAAQSYAWPDFLPTWFELTGRVAFSLYWGSQLARPLGAAIIEAEGGDE